MSTEDVKKSWTSIASKYSHDSGLITELWDEIVTAYTSPNRHYHNLHHISFMLQLFHQYEEKLIKKGEVLFSIFYHDIIYDVKSRKNEENSVKYAALRLLKLGVSPTAINRISKMIVSTKHHEPTDNMDNNYLLDFDLAILSAPEKEYKLYTDQIRNEYLLYPKTMYRFGRKRLLKNLLRQSSIYATEDFQSRNQKALINLERELYSF